MERMKAKLNPYIHREGISNNGEIHLLTLEVVARVLLFVVDVS